MNARKWLGALLWNFLFYLAWKALMSSYGWPPKGVITWLLDVVLLIGMGPLLTIKLIVDWRRKGEFVRVGEVVLNTLIWTFGWATYWSVFGLGLMEIVFENGQPGVIVDQGNPTWKFIIVGIMYFFIFVLPVIVGWFYYIFGYLVWIGD